MVRDFIQEENVSSVSFGNARGVRNIFEQILVHQANRLAAQENVSRDDLMRIIPKDILMARGMEEDAPQNEADAAPAAPEDDGPGHKETT